MADRSELLVQMAGYLVMPLAIMSVLSILTYVVPCVIQAILPSQDLKKKYQAEWALVTGGSSGIGLSIVERLAQQGINVVIAALDDHLMKSAMATLPKTYPSVQFRSVAVNLAGTEYMAKIKAATDDLDIALVFNNAGYIKPGLFPDLPLETVLANYNVNATATLPITHHFARRMQARNAAAPGRRSLIAFTSSSGGFLPGPMTSIYSSTKAWMTNFAASVAAEMAESRVDVLVVHPSPIASNFYQNAGALAVLKTVEKGAASPTVIADAIWKNAGRFTIVDQGSVSVGMKMLFKVLDWNLFGEIMVRMVRTTGDYTAIKAAGAEARKRQ
ncbi:putative short-chain dehydrogenase [Entophlyctis helioformis]|nr:putative short-chain dehydrogenase [Entophlyctis helioformis]